MNTRITPHQYVLANAWDLLRIAESADDLPHDDAQKADKYVEGGADALLAYCRWRVRVTIEHRAD